MIDVSPNTTGTAGAPAPTRRSAPPDLFALGRAAAEAAERVTGGRVVFARARQLTPAGAWRGPRDAADAFVEEEDVAALGGVAAAVELGARTLVARSTALVSAPAAAGLRILLRVPFAAGELEAERLTRLDALLADTAVRTRVDAVVPTPAGEPPGLDTLRFVALCRLRLGVRHVVADFARLGHRLAQMCLTFGADELFGPIAAERALRLGDNAGNPALTRREAATLVRGAGLVPCERRSDGTIEECAP